MSQNPPAQSLLPAPPGEGHDGFPSELRLGSPGHHRGHRAGLQRARRPGEGGAVLRLFARLRVPGVAAAPGGAKDSGRWGVEGCFFGQITKRNGDENNINQAVLGICSGYVIHCNTVVTQTMILPEYW